MHAGLLNLGVSGWTNLSILRFRSQAAFKDDNPVCVQKGISGWSHAPTKSNVTFCRCIITCKTPPQWSRDRETLRETYTLKDPDPRVFTK